MTVTPRMASQRHKKKKIAALTKTVFRLHAETVDRKDELSELKAKYEAELPAAATASQKKKKKKKKASTRHKRKFRIIEKNIDATVRRAPYEAEFAQNEKAI
jgi:serologically defined colon cancer antigen 8